MPSFLTPGGCLLSQPSTTVADPPLVVDLDGTLLKSDMLVESFFALLSEAPVTALAAGAALARGRAALKAAVAARATLDLTRMPWNEGVIDMIIAERARGRRVYLASAADHRMVRAVADHLGLFDGIFASDGTTNLSGAAKTVALCSAFGAGGFDYAGNASVDMAVWEKSRRVIVVNAAARLIAKVILRWPDAMVIGTSHARLRVYVRAIRVYQWVKNALLFVPMLSAHRFEGPLLLQCIVAVASFSLCASSVYVMNDLIDLGRDRSHPTKRHRPFAAGMLPVLNGLAMVPILLAAAILLAVLVNGKFVWVLALYYVATVAYSLDLKRRMMIDVVALACLYGLRLLAGGAATEVALSAWLATFSIFLFTGLALVKRCTELAGRIASGSGDPTGRGYRLTDLPMLEMLATASGFTSILVFQLYVNSDAVAGLYAHPKLLTAVGIVLVYWIGYVLMLTHRGEMQDDPVVFAATNRTSLCCGLIVVAVILLSL